MNRLIPLFTALCAVLSACAQVPQKLDADAFYKRDMKITVNGASAEGVIVAPSSDHYDLEIVAKGKLDLFTLASCHREITQEDAGEGGIFGDAKKIKLTFRPVNGIENTSACPVELGGYEKDLGRHSWGFIDFRSPELTLPAKLKCNGVGQETVGVSVCQSRNGLIEQIVFKAPVRVAKQPDSNCPQLSSSDGGVTFEYKMPLKQCVYVFGDQTGALHRLTTLGYEKILVRGN
jgi:hypothetical protein